MDINSALKFLEVLHRELTDLKEMRDKESRGEWSGSVKVLIAFDEVTEDSFPQVIEGMWPNVWVTAEGEDGLPDSVLCEDDVVGWTHEMGRFLG